MATPTGSYYYGALPPVAIAASVSGEVYQTPPWPTFDNIEFPRDISQEMQGGPGFRTRVVKVSSGAEQRISEQPFGLWRASLSAPYLTNAQTDDLIEFFLARAGKYRAFRFYDWSDHSATNSPLAPTGDSYVQLRKRYDDGVRTYDRLIFAPLSGTTTMTRGGSSFTAFSVDLTTGKVNLSPDVSRTITAITKAATAQVTVAAHGYTVGQYLKFASVGGMTEVNGQVVTVASIVDVNNITVNLNTSAYSTYTSGGTLDKYIQPAEVVTATFEFDYVARFDHDELIITQVEPDYRSIQNLSVTESRNG